MKGAGLKNTEARREVLSLFSKECEPLSAEGLYERLEGRFDLATVYRNLSALERSGVISRVNLRKGVAFYELPDHHHHHIVCTSCGETEQFSDCAVEATVADTLRRAKKFKVINEHALELFGLCRRCEKV